MQSSDCGESSGSRPGRAGLEPGPGLLVAAEEHGPVPARPARLSARETAASRRGWDGMGWKFGVFQADRAAALLQPQGGAGIGAGLALARCPHCKPAQKLRDKHSPAASCPALGCPVPPELRENWDPWGE